MQESCYSKMIWFKDSFLPKNENLKILDVGSVDKYGYYNYKDIFNHHNWEYDGLDFRDGNNVNIIVEDMFNWYEVSSSSYDVVVSSFLFEHLQYYWRVMSEIKRVIKPGGFICIIVPSDGPNLDENVSYNNFQIEDLVKLCEYFDLDVVHTSIDEENEPWCDICIVAFNNFDNSELKIKLDNFDNKLNSFLKLKGLFNNFNNK